MNYVKKIKFDLTTIQFPLAWVKRFSFINSSSQSKSGNGLHAWKSSQPIQLEISSPHDHETILSQAQTKAKNWLKKTLFKELLTYIEGTILGQSPLGFTMMSGQKSWADKVKLDGGGADICREITSLIKELSKRYQIDVIADLVERKLLTDDDQKKLIKKLGRGMLLTDEDLPNIPLDGTASKLFKDMNLRNMTLFVPDCYKQSILTPHGAEAPIKERIEKKFPNLELCYSSELSQATAKFALLIFDEWIQGKNELGQFDLQGSIQITPNPDEVELDKLEELDEHNKLCYELNFPAYQLSLLDPKQIAVLTGI